MRIGIHVSNTRSEGGQFQFLIMFLDALFASNAEHDVYLFYFDDVDKLSQRYQKDRWNWVRLKKELQLPSSNELVSTFVLRFLSLFKKITKKLLRYLGIIVTLRKERVKKNIDSILGWRRKLKENFISKYKLDFIFFPIWTDRCWEWGIPFAFAVHDLQHRLQPEFPEVSLVGRWNWREDFFSEAISKTKIVLVDSEEGKRNVLQFYNCDPEKIKILPYTLPSCSTIKISEQRREEIINRFNIPQKFFFYPANFWSHKNHYRIIEAMGLLKKRQSVEIPVVFVGKTYAQWEILSMCEALAERCLVKNQIYYFDYVNDEELVALYMTAVGLVMPTYFGPTNIPYLEAFYYRCPVIASDIPGIKEQVGEAAFLVNPKDIGAISDAMYRIWTDRNLKERLIEKGQEQLAQFLPKHFKEKVDSIIDNLSKEMI